jgi:flagella basal body P-ring formation protein FlgA
MPHDPTDIAEVRVPSIADLLVPLQSDLEVRFRADEDFTGSVIADVIITDAGELVRSRRVNTHVDLYVDALGLHEELRRGQTVTTGDLVVLRVAQSRLPKDAIIKPEFIDGAQVRRTVRPGEVIRGALLKVPPLVERGQRVRMIARRGQVSVTTIGEALSSGPRGTLVRVRNLESRKIVGGKVISSGVVEMEF